MYALFQYNAEKRKEKKAEKNGSTVLHQQVSNKKFPYYTKVHLHVSSRDTLNFFFFFNLLSYILLVWIPE